MAADVSTMVKSGNSEILITRDLLGELSKAGNNDLDLDLHVSKPWELPLDLKSGMLCKQQKCKSPNPSSPPSSLTKKQTQLLKQKTTQEREAPINSSNLKFMEESHLELKLVPSSRTFQSVCTLDKVKSALQRAQQESSSCSSIKKRIISTKKEEHGDDYHDEGKNKGFPSSSTQTGMFAAGCPGCLMYVMTMKANPKCPRCNSIVPSPLLPKKPRIDLNTSL